VYGDLWIATFRLAVSQLHLALWSQPKSLTTHFIDIPSIHSFYRACLGTRERLPYQTQKTSTDALIIVVVTSNVQLNVWEGRRVYPKYTLHVEERMTLEHHYRLELRGGLSILIPQSCMKESHPESISDSVIKFNSTTVPAVSVCADACCVYSMDPRYGS
jgi:hypothetical protein